MWSFQWYISLKVIRHNNNSVKVTFHKFLKFSCGMHNTVVRNRQPREQRAVAWWQTTSFLQSECLGLPMAKAHEHLLSHAVPQTAYKTEVSFVHPLYLFALVSLMLPAPHTWSLPFNHYYLNICYFLSMEFTLATLSSLPASNQAGSGSPCEHSHLSCPLIWKSAFLNWTLILFHLCL